LTVGADCVIGSNCVFVSQQDYSKSNQLTSLKLGVMIRPAGWKNWSTFGGDPIQNTESGSLFQFPHHCRIRHFGRFISSSHSHRPLSQNWAKWLMLTRDQSGRHTDRINPDSNPGSLSAKISPKWLALAAFKCTLLFFLLPRTATSTMFCFWPPCFVATFVTCYL